MLVKWALLCGVISIFLVRGILYAFESPVKANNHKVKTVVIDAGHGGKDPGCHGKGSKEKEVTLAVALELSRLIKAYQKDVKVILTRDDDTFVELNDRASIANKNHADVFISIHCNSEPSKKIEGTETYCMGLHTSEGNLSVAKRENSVILLEKNYLDKYEGFDPNSPLQHIFFANLQNGHLAKSLQLAEKIENQFKTKAVRKSRGVRQAGFIVLWKTAMPSVLCEIGYLTSGKEEKYLHSDSGQEKTASAIYRAFRDYKEELEN